MAGKSKGANSYDLIVIGGGPGGYVAAIRAAQLGMNVACVEADKLGGVCLNIGCIPTKALLSSAHLIHQLEGAAAHGVHVDGVKVDFKPAQERSRRVADQLNKGVAHLFKKNGVTHVAGYCRLAGNGKVAVEVGKGKKEPLTAPHILVATGSRARDIPVLKIDGERIWSSDHALLQTKAPGRIAIVGAGAVGMEFADIFNAFDSEVVIIEMLDRVLPVEDKDCSAVVAKRYKSRGMEIHTSATLEKTEIGSSGVRLTVRTKDGKETRIEAEYVLSAVGRVPNTEDVGLETVGAKHTEKGNFLQIDERMRTNAQGVYAVGDVARPPLLAHKASHEGIVAVEHMAGQGHGTIDYGNIPNCTYCHPEVASVGLTEDEARQQGYDIDVGKFPWVGNGRALAGGEAEGFVKVIRDRRYSEVLGAHIVGPSATELIAEFVVGRHLETTSEEMERAIHPHPTLSEAIAEAALASLGRPIHI